MESADSTVGMDRRDRAGSEWYTYSNLEIWRVAPGGGGRSVVKLAQDATVQASDTTSTRH
jgi:hypothetical protein